MESKLVDVKGQESVAVVRTGAYDKELRLYGVNGSVNFYYWNEVTEEELSSLGEFAAMVTQFYKDVSTILEEEDNG